MVASDSPGMIGIYETGSRESTGMATAAECTGATRLEGAKSKADEYFARASPKRGRIGD